MTATLSPPVVPLPPHDRGADRSLRTQELFEAVERCTDDDERRQLLDEVVTINLEVADTLAAQYAGRGVPFDDLSQTARLALVRVTRNFSLDRRCDFLAYAVPSIRGTLKRYFRDHTWMVRPPRRLQEARLAINSARQGLRHSLGEEPSVHELAEVTSLPERVVTEALSTGSCYTPDSLDRPVGTDDDATLGGVVGEEDDGFARVEQQSLLASLLCGLPERDRRVLELRFADGLTQEEIGRQIGVSQMQVSRMLTRILGRLRAAAASMDGTDLIKRAG